MSETKEIICPMCSKKMGELEVENPQKGPLYGGACDTCKGFMSEGITLWCANIVGHNEAGEPVPCSSITVANIDKIREHLGDDIEPGTVQTVVGCPICAKDKAFHFPTDLSGVPFTL